MREWMRVAEVAKLMGMTRRGALKRLQVKNRQFGGRLLRRERVGAPWEVSVSVLHEERGPEKRRLGSDGETPDLDLQELRERIDEMDVRLVGVRNSHNAWRRKFDKRLKKHATAITKLGEGAQAVKDLLECPD